MGMIRRVAWLIPVMAVSSAAGQTIVWTGAVGNRWDDARNWQPERLPGPEDDVFIGPGESGVGGIGTAHRIRSLTLARRFALFGEHLTIDGDIHLDDGTLIVSTFFLAVPFSSLTLTGEDRHVTGKGVLWVHGGESSQFHAEGRLTIGPDVAVLADALFSSIGGRPWHMQGSIIVSRGASVSMGSLVNLDPATLVLTGGVWILKDRATLGQPSVIRGIGPDTLVQIGEGARFSSLEWMASNEGTLRIGRSASLALVRGTEPDVTNTGTIQIGANGRINSLRRFVQNAEGLLELECDGLNPSTENVQGHAGFDLAGALRVRFAPEFQPGANDVYTLLAGTPVVGRFESVDLDPRRPQAHVVYSADRVVLAVCHANCDGSQTLDIFDYLCFADHFAAGDSYACDCDTTTGQGVCDVFDFICFGNRFAAGCE